jgi:hypothetical protein
MPLPGDMRVAGIGVELYVKQDRTISRANDMLVCRIGHTTIHIHAARWRFLACASTTNTVRDSCEMAHFANL